VSYTNVDIAGGAGNFLTITVAGTVNPATTGNLVNTATVTTGTGQTDPTPANNTATDTDTAAPSTDLTITKTDGSPTYTAGASISYSIVVSNAGPSKMFTSCAMTRLSHTTRLSSTTGRPASPRAWRLPKSSTTRLATAAVRVASLSMSAKMRAAM
jgi:hypothetical protein